MKSLAMHITNQKLSFEILTVENVMVRDFYSKWSLAYNIDNFDPCNVLLAIATNIPVLRCGPGYNSMQASYAV